MKTKTFIKLLQKLDPNGDMNLSFCTASGSESGKVKGASLDGPKHICIDVQTTHNFGEKP